MLSIFLWGFIATATPTVDPLLAFCREAVLSKGFRSGLEEKRCEYHFDLPSPFLVKCLRQFVAGELSPTCRVYPSMNHNWGPWMDIELPEELSRALPEYRMFGMI